MRAPLSRHEPSRPASAISLRHGPDTVEAPIVAALGPAHAAEQIADLAPRDAIAAGCLCFEDEFGGFVVVPIAGRAMRIGRGLAADIAFEDPTVSHRHALVARDGDSVWLLDDRSLNGLFVNGSRVSSRALADGDVIGVGRHRLYYMHRPGGGRGGSRELALAAA